MEDSAIISDCIALNTLRVTENFWLCPWCETFNENSATSQGEQCIACRQLKSSVVWKTVLGDEMLATIRNAYLLADFSCIANGVGERRVSQTDVKYVNTSLKIALAVELDLLDIYYCPSKDENGVRPTLGWRWPNKNYVSGVVLSQENKDGRKVFMYFPKSDEKNDKAVNLKFEKSFDPTKIKLAVGLFFDDEIRVDSRPRFIKYEVEGGSL